MPRKLSILVLLICICSGNLFAKPWIARQPENSDYLDSWIDRSVDELIRTWGPATLESNLTDGSRVLKYEKTIINVENPTYTKGNIYTETKKTKQGNYYTVTTDTSYYNPGSTKIYTAEVILTVNKEQKISDWSYKGNTEALQKIIIPSSIFDLNSFFFDQYIIRSREWIGFTIKDIKQVYDSKILNYEADISYPGDDTIVMRYNLPNTNCETTISFIIMNEKISDVILSGKAENIQKLYRSPYRIILEESIDGLLIGLSYNTDNDIGAHYDTFIDMFGNRLKLSVEYGFYFGDKKKELDLTMATPFFIVDNYFLRVYTGVGVLFGWNFSSIDNGFKFGVPLLAGLQAGPIDLRYVFKVGKDTNQRIQLSYIIRY